MKKPFAPNFIWLALAGLFFGLLTLGQLQRWQLTAHVAIYYHDLVVLTGLLLWAVSQRSLLGHFLNWQRLSTILRDHWLEFGFGVWIMGGLGWSFWQGGEALTGVLYVARLVSYSLFTLVLLRAKFWQQLPHTIAHLSLKYWAYLAAGAMILVFGWLQYLLLPDTRFLGLLGWDNHYYRLLSTQLDPAFAGMLLVLTLLLSFQVQTRSWLKWVWYSIVTIAIALTFSRASYLSLGAGIATFTALSWWRTRRWRPELLIVLILLISLPFLPRKGGEGVNLTRTSTITARVTAANDNVTSVSTTQWLVGRGLFVPDKIESDNVRRPDRATLPDNLVVLVVTQLGVIGSVWLLLILLKHRQWWWRQPVLTLSSLAAVLLHSQFNQTLFQPFVFLFWWGILVIGYLQPTAKETKV